MENELEAAPASTPAPAANSAVLPSEDPAAASHDGPVPSVPIFPLADPDRGFEQFLEDAADTSWVPTPLAGLDHLLGLPSRLPDLTLDDLTGPTLDAPFVEDGTYSFAFEANDFARLVQVVAPTARSGSITMDRAPNPHSNVRRSEAQLLNASDHVKLVLTRGALFAQTYDGISYAQILIPVDSNASTLEPGTKVAMVLYLHELAAAAGGLGGTVRASLDGSEQRLHLASETFERPLNFVPPVRLHDLRASRIGTLDRATHKALPNRLLRRALAYVTRVTEERVGTANLPGEDREASDTVLLGSDILSATSGFASATVTTKDFAGAAFRMGWSVTIVAERVLAAMAPEVDLYATDKGYVLRDAYTAFGFAKRREVKHPRTSPYRPATVCSLMVPRTPLRQALRALRAAGPKADERDPTESTPDLDIVRFVCTRGEVLPECALESRGADGKTIRIRLDGVRRTGDAGLDATGIKLHVHFSRHDLAAVAESFDSSNIELAFYPDAGCLIVRDADDATGFETEAVIALRAKKRPVKIKKPKVPRLPELVP
ncbi:hypothetical protein MKK75_32075 [Methylobacterium sp. J-030]|uniref:hypothetical protein n=1 Tax=Methylobacterium sp. J-030 TaxID=2836627 RepID=UPI001FB9C195|nr:hypothetical protein [Methylobacterium sp. J-030]MCJ2073372.1 hypothetical protein [Methylobacterium sp. J-030]